MNESAKPRIIISSYDDLQNPYYGGGGAVAIYEVFKRLTNSFQVKVITGKYPQSKNEVIEEITYQRIGISLFGPKIGQLIFQLLLPLYVLTQKFDLWVENFTPPFSTACLQLFTKKPVVGLVHMLSGKDMLRKYRIPFYLIEYLGLKTYKYFIVLSEISQKMIASINKTSSFSLAPNGVHLPSRLVSYLKRNKKSLIFIGRIEVDQKGLDLLIRALSLIKDEVPFNFIIAGDGQKKEVRKLDRLISFYHLQNKVELLGKVNGQVKMNLFQQALMAVIPSRFETFSLSALEVFSYGIPLIVFDIEGLKWIPKNCALKIPTQDAEKLSQGILKLYQDTRLRNGLSQRSFALAKKYSWENTSLKYRNFFEKILKQ